LGAQIVSSTPAFGGAAVCGARRAAREKIELRRRIKPPVVRMFELIYSYSRQP
jgi:hypothetical protein